MTPSSLDKSYMGEALKEAKFATEEGEVPIGAVIVRDGEIIARAHNRREHKGGALGHAELLAIDAASTLLGGWRLTGCTLYVTLEPCPMCAGAIIHSRIPRVVYGAADERGGACGSVCNLFVMPFGHEPKVTRGVLEKECASLLSEFFSKLRQKNV